MDPHLQTEPPVMDMKVGSSSAQRSVKTIAEEKLQFISIPIDADKFI